MSAGPRTPAASATIAGAPASRPQLLGPPADGWVRSLSVVALASALICALAGFFVDDLYRDPASTSSMLRGYDLVTLLITLPALALALVGARRGSVRATLIWLGVLASLVYSYGFGLFATAFNEAFLAQVVTFASALLGLGLALSRIDVGGLAEAFSPRLPTRWISALLAFLALGLGGMWIVYSVRFAMTGQLPAGSALVETDPVVHLGFVLDLSLLVPGYAVAASLLWRRTDWGFLLAAVLLVSGTIHQVAYLVAMPFQVAAKVPGAVAFDPGEPLIAVPMLLAVIGFLAAYRRLPTSPGRVGE